MIATILTAAMIVAAVYDCASVKPGFEWLLGYACAAQAGGGSGIPHINLQPGAGGPPSPPGGAGDPPGDPGGSDSPGKSGGSHGNHGDGSNGNGKN